MHLDLVGRDAVARVGAAAAAHAAAVGLLPAEQPVGPGAIENVSRKPAAVSVAEEHVLRAGRLGHARNRRHRIAEALAPQFVALTVEGDQPLRLADRPAAP